MSFAEACGVADASRAAACEAVSRRMRDEGIDLVRIGWCDTHGILRGKTLTAAAVPRALAGGIGLVSTILLKDTSDRTAYRVFEPGATDALPGFGFANNLMLLPDPASFRVLPWAPGTGWMRAEAWFDDGAPVPLDTRRILGHAIDRLAERGLGLTCGLEVEFHIYRLADPLRDPASLDPERAAWPGEPPAMTMIHPGYNLLAEGWADRADEPLRIVQRTAQGLGLPLASLEIELGPSQVEAVFEATDALTAADHMVAFRNGVTQALRRAGYHASFVCRPPFPNVMASGWHLHQSLRDLESGGNAFMRDAPAAGSDGGDAQNVLSAAGESWLAGLLAHGRSMAVFCAPTINAYGRFRPNAMAPNAVVWGRDNRGAMLRVLGRAGDPGTRIENRIGEPAANPYLYMAAQIHAGLDGLARGLAAPPATAEPYAQARADTGADPADRLPVGLGEALDALAADERLVAAFGAPVVAWLTQVKRSELARHDQAEDKDAWQAREYFSRF
ncbi:MAG: glutamine synthetase family protein [Burkholderiales bacterium]|nr:glutamine synthetase family protein [Burkholderiales bacterium]